MGQVLRQNDRAVRRAIQNSQKSIAKLAECYSVNSKTRPAAKQVKRGRKYGINLKKS